MKQDVQLLRKFSGLTQTQFWESVGITQSGGSRYEAGERRLPKPVQELLRLVYVEKIDLKTIRRKDMDVLAYLKREQTTLYKDLLRDSGKFWNQHR